MLSNPYVTVHIDLDRIRANVEQIQALVKVPMMAVVKADAYGLGAAKITESIAEIVESFCVFDLQEATDAKIYRRTGKRTLALGPPSSMNPADWHVGGRHAGGFESRTGGALAARAARVVCRHRHAAIRLPAGEDRRGIQSRRMLRSVHARHAR